MATGIFGYIDDNGDEQTLTNPADGKAYDIQAGPGVISNDTDALAQLYLQSGGNGQEQALDAGLSMAAQTVFRRVQFIPRGFGAVG